MKRATDIAAAVAADLEQRGASAGRARILLVDDDERNLLALTEVLEPLAESSPLTRDRGAARAAGTTRRDPGDVFMPNGGYETAPDLQARNPAHSDHLLPR